MPTLLHAAGIPHYGRPSSRSAAISLSFVVGDCVALSITTAVATWGMMIVHDFIPNVALAMVVGMLVSMLASMILAACAGIVLGSIETKVPAMLAGMLAPMPFCALSLAGHAHPSLGVGVATGAAVGLALSLALIAYGRRCRSDFKEGQWRC